MREYEVTVIFQPQLDEEARNQLIERVTGWLTHGDGEEAKPVAHVWGQKKMAYPIRKYTEGYYMFYEANLNPAQVSEVERSMKYVDDILRYLVVRKED